MTRQRTTRATLAAAAVAAACTTALLAAPGTALADPGHENPEPGDIRTFDGPLALMGPDKAVLRKYRGRVYQNLQVRAVAGAGDLEVRSNRLGEQPYENEITTSWTLGEESGTFPVGMQEQFSGLPDLLRTTYRDADGEVVRETTMDACLNGDGERVQPEAAARNRYPWGCPYNAYTLGSVQGVQDGWATRVETWGSRVRLPLGTYAATVEVNEPYASAWGLDPDDAHVEMTVKVREPRERREGRRTAARSTAGDAPQETTAQPAAREPSGRGAAAPPEGTPLPDLRSLPAFDINLNGTGNQMRFAANVWNGGNSPLVIDGFRTEDEDVMAAYQYFFDTEGEQVGYEAVEDSGFYWHAENHNHWHFEDFAKYQLLDADKNVVQDSGKVSFCLANTDAVDYTVPGADWRPENTDLSTSCGQRRSLSVREVLSAGSGDTYAQYRAGQAFGGIRDLPNGRYYVRVHANPNDALIESDTTNNVEDRLIRLRGKGTERRVVVSQVGLIDDEQGGYFFGFRR